MLEIFVDLIKVLLAALFVFLGRNVWRASRERIKVRPLTQQGDSRTPGMLALFASLFPGDTNYSSEDVLAWLEGPRGERKLTHVHVKDFVFTAECREQVIGFIFRHYYPAERSAIISYFGIDKESLAARQKAAQLILKKLRSALLKCSPPCHTIVCEIQKRQEGHKVLFKSSASRLGLKLFELGIDYRRPPLHLTDTTEEELLLMCASLHPLDNMKFFQRDHVLKVLEFVHLSCYGDFYERNTPEHAEFHTLLEQRLNYYRATLQAEVAVT